MSITQNKSPFSGKFEDILKAKFKSDFNF